jgi:hypothetical protein
VSTKRLSLVIFGFALFGLPGTLPAVVPQDSSVIVAQGLTNTGRTRAIGRDSRGWLYAVYWTEYAGGDVYCSRSTDNGRTWTRLQGLNYELADQPAMAIDRGDSVYVTWRKVYVDTLGSDVFLRVFNGTSWSPPLNISNQHTQGGIHHVNTITVDGDNHPHVLWDNNDELYHSYHDGNGWTPPQYIGPGIFASLTPDTGSALHLVYYSIYVSGEIAYRRWSSGSWGPEEAVNDSQSYVGYPSVVGDARGFAHVAWPAGDTIGIGQMFYSRRQGGVWTPSIPISTICPHQGTPTITCDSSANLYVAWQRPYPDTIAFSQQVFYSTFNGSSWSPETLTTSDTSRYHGQANFGFPVTSYGVDLLWTTYAPHPAYKDSVVYLRLPLVGTGAEGEKQVEPSGEGLRLSVQSPVRSRLIVRYFLPQSAIQNQKSKVSLYDLSGRLVAMFDEGVKPFGWHELKAPLNRPSGVYFLRLEAGKSSLTRKFVLLR